MLAGGSDAAYRRILAGGGQFQRRLEVWRGGARVDTTGDSGVPIRSGSLSANLANRVTRKLRVSLDQSLFPWNPGDLLDPLGAELVMWCGWRAGADAPRMWPVFTGPINTVSMDLGSSSFTVEATDRVESIIEDRFTEPVNSGAGALVTTRIMDLISDSQPGAVFGQIDETFAVVPSLTWDSDRAKAIDDLAAGVGCYWYQLPDGRYTVRVVPWSQTLGAPVATITEGVDLVGGTVSRTRSGVYTACQVTGEAATGDVPVIGVAQDLDPASPTYILGPLGRRVLQVREDSVPSTAQAQSLAAQRLRRASALSASVSTTTLFDPAIELGDTAMIVTQGGSFLRSLASFSANLGSMPSMNSQWRAPGGDEE
jgi:hypothetical protein